uniref:Uncharacterized protein n=1 Tax=Globisporangium ultimum (strain ATCC 200006 / CBS 805.95 / DAOM BR144) TaxID=431595 RepID=K3W5H0_GLOUD
MNSLTVMASFGSYRTFKYQLQHNAKLRRKRQAFMRLIISKEQCYQRMNENIRARQERMWSASS